MFSKTSDHQRTEIEGTSSRCSCYKLCNERINQGGEGGNRKTCNMPDTVIFERRQGVQIGFYNGSVQSTKTHYRFSKRI